MPEPTTQELEKKVLDLETTIQDLTKRAEESEHSLVVAKLDEDDRKAYEALTKEQQEKFVTCKSDDCREGLINKGYEAIERADAVPEAIQKQMEDIRKELNAEKTKREAAETQIRKAQDEADTIRFSKQAETELPNLPGTAEEKGGVLKAMKAKMTAEECEAAMKLFKAGNEAHGKLTSPLGKDNTGEAGNSAWNQIESRAKEIAKAENLSQASAISKVMVQEPKLYQQYLDEEHGRRS